MELRFGIVVEAHPQDHSVDVIMTDDFSRMAGVQVLSYNGGPDVGTADLFCPAVKSGDDKWSMARRTALDLKAAIIFGGSMPVVVGFLYPQIGQMTFPDANRRVQRHSSDVYSTVDSSGNMEVAFPNGTFFRVGTSPDHEDLTGKDFDKKWAIKKNTSAATHVRLVVGNAGAVKADIHIAPNGDLTGTFQGKGDITTVGDLTITAPHVTVNASEAATINTKTATLNASTKVELSTPLVHCTTNLTVDGNALVKGSLTYQGGMSGSGGTGSTATIIGNVAITGGNVTADGIGLKTHHHVEHDGPSTGPAVA